MFMTEEMVIKMPSANAVRSYISTLRSARGLSQEEMAKAIGMGKRTYIAWETGEIQDIKAPFLMKAIQLLGGAFEHLEQLLTATPEEAQALAEYQLSHPEKEAIREAMRERVRHLSGDEIAKLIEVGENLPPEQFFQWLGIGRSLGGEFD